MNGMALLFMVFFWSFIVVLVTFCLTLLLYSGDKKREAQAPASKAEVKSGG